MVEILIQIKQENKPSNRYIYLIKELERQNNKNEVQTLSDPGGCK